MSQLFYDKVQLLNTPLPEATDSYAPMSHKDVIELTLETLDKANMAVKSESYIGSKFGKQAIGCYEIASIADPEMCIRIMWNNSYDKTCTLKWAIGGHVFVCGNGMVVGDMGTFKRKHTGDVRDEYQTAIGLYIQEAEDLFTGMVRDKERMKEVGVNKRQIAELVGRMHIENEIITATQVGIIKKEIDHPTHNYNADGTLWQLYNHTTFALKEAHPQFYINQHMNVHNFFNEYIN